MLVDLILNIYVTRAGAAMEVSMFVEHQCYGMQTVFTDIFWLLAHASHYSTYWYGYFPHCEVGGFN
jgi:hypothetical protein